MWHMVLDFQILTLKIEYLCFKFYYYKINFQIFVILTNFNKTFCPTKFFLTTFVKKNLS